MWRARQALRDEGASLPLTKRACMNVIELVRQALRDEGASLPLTKRLEQCMSQAEVMKLLGEHQAPSRERASAAEPTTAVDLALVRDATSAVLRFGTRADVRGRLDLGAGRDFGGRLCLGGIPDGTGRLSSSSIPNVGSRRDARVRRDMSLVPFPTSATDLIIGARRDLIADAALVPDATLAADAISVANSWMRRSMRWAIWRSNDQQG